MASQGFKKIVNINEILIHDSFYYMIDKELFDPIKKIPLFDPATSGLNYKTTTANLRDIVYWYDAMIRSNCCSEIIDEKNVWFLIDLIKTYFPDKICIIISSNQNLLSQISKFKKMKELFYFRQY